MQTHRYKCMADIFATLIKETDKVISIVGGGGKTSLLFLLARGFQEEGLTVVTTTTTRILAPASWQTGTVVLSNGDDFYEKLQHSLKLHGHITVGKSLLPGGDKLEGICCNQVEHIIKQSFVDRIIVEADGARQLPFKAPGDKEPVVPGKTDLFISVVGLDVVGRSLEEKNVFRAEQVSSRTGLQMGATISPLTVAKLAVHPEGLLKGCPKMARSCLFLNKMDISGGREKALSVMDAAKGLEGRKPDIVVTTSIKEKACEILSFLS